MKEHRFQRPDRPAGLSGMLRKWAAFLFGLALLWAFMFVLAPWLQRSPSVKPLADYIQENDIDASALYYTEVKEAAEAELNMRHTREYGPAGPGSSE